MKTKLLAALKLAFSRFLVGALGTWCVLGPIVLMIASESASPELKVMLALLLAPCYAILLVICLRSKWDALKEIASETRLAICFMLVGLLLNEITGIFLGVKHKLVLVYAFVGFLLSELARPVQFIKAFNEYLPKHATGSNDSAIKNDLSKEPAPREFSIDNDGLAHQIAELSGRLAESQRTLADYEQQQRSLVSAQTEIEQLRDLIDSLGNQLAASESQVKQATVSKHQADEVNETLQSEVAVLKQQLAERQDRIETLHSAAQQAARIQLESQAVRVDNQGLREEVTSQRIQLDAKEIRLRELAGQNLEAANRYQRLETEVTDLRRQLSDNQSAKDRELASARQQLADVEDRERYYRQQQPQLEARVADLERELTEVKIQAQVLDDTRRRWRDSQRIRQELADENCRLWQEVSRWRESFAASGQARLAADSNDPKVRQTGANGGAELSLDEHSLLPANAHQRAPAEMTIWETESPNGSAQRGLGEHLQLSSGDSPAGVSKEKDASWMILTAVKHRWQFGALAAAVMAIAGAVAMGTLASRFSPPKNAPVAIESTAAESRAQAVSKPQSKPQPQLRGAVETVRPTPRRRTYETVRPPTPMRGTFETILSTQVYDEPSENGALVGAIHSGMKVSVVNSRQGWLEIRSKHGRADGFIRQETAVMVARN